MRVGARDRPFLTQTQIAVLKVGGNPNRIGRQGSGRFNARGRGAKVVASLPRPGRGWQSDATGRFRGRRVLVKARVVRLAATHGAKGVDAVRRRRCRRGRCPYALSRRGRGTAEGEKGHAYSAVDDEADGRAFFDRGRDDRHQFRVIVAPEMGDLRGFARCSPSGPRQRFGSSGSTSNCILRLYSTSSSSSWMSAMISVRLIAASPTCSA
ncbi:hypothetical protein C7I85_23265 [Mesorhizobium soli]|uniref:Uncharacterized protein n=2 Tax=Pseudaminobacter soli (ex Li et al. 2025) TaxID=1295366 RepID=A0A2P7S3Y0_9HYPH|nr:hypothetical protein C7I85_23265 [Mesorhizobium soli]